MKGAICIKVKFSLSLPSTLELSGTIPHTREGKWRGGSLCIGRPWEREKQCRSPECSNARRVEHRIASADVRKKLCCTVTRDIINRAQTPAATQTTKWDQSVHRVRVRQKLKRSVERSKNAFDTRWSMVWNARARCLVSLRQTSVDNETTVEPACSVSGRTEVF